MRDLRGRVYIIFFLCLVFPVLVLQGCAISFPYPIYLNPGTLYTNETVPANGKRAYRYALNAPAPGNYVLISELSSDLDLSVYEYNSASDKIEDQLFIARSAKPGLADEQVDFAAEADTEYLIIVKDVSGTGGIFSLFIGN